MRIQKNNKVCFTVVVLNSVCFILWLHHQVVTVAGAAARSPRPAMYEEHHLKLWVIKFCLKIIFPRYNLYLFLVHMAIKYRIEQQRRASEQHRPHLAPGGMNVLRLRSVPATLHHKLIREHLKDSKLPGCLIVPYNIYLRLATENPFYLDRNTVWVALHLAPNLKQKCKSKLYSKEKDKLLKYDLNYMKSELNRKLWANDNFENYRRVRIVQVIGSKRISEGVILITETEEFNIKNCYGLTLEEDILEVQLKPVRSIDHVPQIATSTVVQMVLNPFDLSNDFIAELLGNYFEVPKLVHSDDIFSIDLTKEMTKTYHYKYLDLIESTPKLYFKCGRINSVANKDLNDHKENIVLLPYYIVRGKTELNLGESIHSIVPTSKYHLSQEMSDHIVDACPYGLKKYFCKIQEALFPFLVERQNNPMHCSVSSPIMPIFLLSGSMGSGRHLVVKTLANYNGLNCLVVDCNSIQSSTAKQTESRISSLIQKAKASSPAIVLMDNFEVFAVDAENNEDCRILEYFEKMTTSLFENYTKHPIIFIAVTGRSDLKPNILRIFLEKFHISRPNNFDRQLNLEWFFSAMQLKLKENSPQDAHVNYTNCINDLDSTESKLSAKVKEILQKVSAKTETFSYGDIDTLVHFALRNSFMTQQENLLESCTDGVKLQNVREEDFSLALESIRALQSEHMDAPKIPKVYWQDIGGLDKLKKELLKTIELPIKYPHLFKNSSLKRSGILLYGPPGCGKTLVAKALSTELNVSFLSVKGPELLNMYIGQSEENVRKVFESARASSPCIVFLDELDALAPRRGATGDSGGASDRVVSQLLAEIDGVADSGHDSTESSSFVFIMGATNRPDLLEQSLLRPGRLDKLIYVGPYDGLDEKTKVLTALCRSHNVSSDVKLEEIAGWLPERCTGADMLQVVTVARSAAVRNVVQRLQAGEVKESELESSSLVIGMPELKQGVDSFKPSTTEDEFAYYESLQGHF